MPVVYVDVLFLINFCMDFLALRSAGAILHIPAKRCLLLLAAILGGVYAVASALFPGDPLVAIVIGGGVAALLCYVAYGGRCGKPRFFGLVLLFFLISWLLGGMITAFYEFLGGFFKDRGELLSFLLDGDGKLAVFFGLAALAAVFLGIGRRQLLHRRHAEAVRLTIFEGEDSETVSAMVDSGNTLTDPLSGRPCIVLTAGAAVEIVPDDIKQLSAEAGLDPTRLSDGSRRRIRVIPAESLGGNQLLIGYVPTKLLLATEGEEERCVDAVLVLDPRERVGYNGYGALVPATLIS